MVASSKLIKSAGDRVKIDARDEVHLARPLHLDEYTPEPHGWCVLLGDVAASSRRHFPAGIR
ncbi:MAG: hypothetical protein ACK5LN_04340 [Propioniciclava sp.]